MAIGGTRNRVTVRGWAARLLLAAGALGVLGALHAAPVDAAALRVIRASGTGLTPANSDSFYGAAAVGGSSVVFQSTASTLATSGPYSDIFVRDLRSGYTRCLTKAPNASASNGPSDSCSIASDGSIVAFTSAASNLVDEDTNATRDVFIRAVATGTTQMVSTPRRGAAADGDSHSPVISGDGRTVAFVSTASNLTAHDLGARSDIFVRDLFLRETLRISVGVGGAEANGESSAPSISRDGTKIAFVSTASNLVVGDGNGVSDVFLYDTVTRSLTRISTSTGRAQGNLGSFSPSVSGDGTKVAFESLATNFVTHDTNGVRDIFVRDLVKKTTVRASVGTSSRQASSECREPSISSDGRKVAFSSSASNLVARDTNRAADVFVRDLKASTTSRISVAPATQSNGSSGGASISPDGLHVVFHSMASNLVISDSNRRNDVFVAALDSRFYDRVAGSSVYDTAARCSQRAFPGGATAAVIVNGGDWRMALVGSGLAGAVKGPILYTSKTVLPTQTRAELARLGVTRAYILGDTASVSASVTAELQDLLTPGAVTRVGSGSAYSVDDAVSALIVQLRGTGFDGRVLIAGGGSSRDSIPGAALASATGRPVVLVAPTTRTYRLPIGTKSALILGRTTAVGSSTESALKRALGSTKVTRVTGADSYRVAVAEAKWGVGTARLSWDGIVLINPARSTTTAVAGASMAGQLASVAIATAAASLPTATRDALVMSSRRIDAVHVVGSTSDVSSSVVSAAKRSLGG